MAKNISEIDKNLQVQSILPENCVLYNALSEPFEVYGLHEPKATGLYMRGPAEMQQDDTLSDGVRTLLSHTAGGRVKFATNSKLIAIKIKVPSRTTFSHMTPASVCGIDMYTLENGSEKFAHTFVPPYDPAVLEWEAVFEFEEAQERYITLNLPLYNPVSELYIGLDKKASVSSPLGYTFDKPIVFYGSSVTQGCSASRPGMAHTALLSRWLDCDYINLGFSGSDKGEPNLAKYISDLPMSAFVHGYGYNCGTLEHFKATYYDFYKTVRDKNPELPIIMMSSPVSATLKEKKRETILAGRRQEVMRSYLKGMSEGDLNLYFVDGFGALGDGDMGEEATVDGTHPTDIGFYNMAKKLLPILRKVVK